MRILSIDGGGYLGLASASFLETLETRFGTSCHKRFNLFCGTSTGALIALALASGKSAAEIGQFYEAFGPKIFSKPGFLARHAPRLRGLFSSRNGNEALKQALEGVFGDITLGDLRAQGKFALIPAFCLTNGRPRIFKTDHAPELAGHDRYLLRDIALASAAAPTYFPVASIVVPGTKDVEWFCDGSYVANSPALLGYAEAVSHFGRSPADISLLSVSATTTDAAEHESQNSDMYLKPNRGIVDWGPRLVTHILAGTSQISESVLQRIALASGARYCRVDIPQPPGVALDIATPAATRTLRLAGAELGRSSTLLGEVGHFFNEDSSHG